MKKDHISQHDRISQIKDVLDEYSICYGDKGIQDNLDSYSRNKRGLLSILRKHPRWNEDAMAVVLDVMASREIDKGIIAESKDRLYHMLSDMQSVSSDDLDRFHYGLKALLRDPDKLLPKNESLKNDLRQTCGFAYIAGQKTSKAVGKLCRQYTVNEHSDYEPVFATLADALNPLSIPRKAILSVHPCDYLQMSGSKNSWTSCHNIGDGGAASGTLSYMNDAVSMIFYTLEPGNENIALYNRPKITRTVFCYNGGFLLQSRLYPKDSDINQRDLDRRCVQSIFAECLKKPNLWKLSQSDSDMERYIHTVKNHLHYADYVEGYNFSLSFLKAYPEYPSMAIGHNAFCLHCGKSLLNCNGKVVCGRCARLIRCADCGAVVEKEYGKMIDGRYHCHLCIAACDHCGKDVPAGDLSMVRHSASEQISVCKECRNSGYFQCVRCGEYHLAANQSNYEGQPYCLDCHAELEKQNCTQENTVVEFPEEMRRAS